MPQALVDKIERSRKFNQGYATVEYLAAAIVDMDLHTGPTARSIRRVRARSAGAHRHAARGGDAPPPAAVRAPVRRATAYSAGYYSYLWSEVMAADTWKAFLEAGGPWDKAVAERFRAVILAEANSTDRAEAVELARTRSWSGEPPAAPPVSPQRRPCAGPTPGTACRGGRGGFAPPATVNNQTIRQIVRVSLGAAASGSC